MSDSEDSTVTYTQISSPFADLSDIGSPGVDGPPIMPDDPYAYVVAAFQVPPSPDYMPGPEEPHTPLPLDFVSDPVYLEFMPSDDEVLPAEEHPLPAAASPTDQSPGYIPESDPEEDPEEDDEDPDEDPVNYPADRDDDNEEEEEHPAPADSVPPPPVHRMTARISIRAEPSISLPPREEIPSPPLPALPPASSGEPSTSHPLPLPTSSPPLQLLSSDHRTDRPEITLPPRKRLGIDLGPRYEIGESSAVATTRPIGGRRADYGFVDTMDTEIRRLNRSQGGRLIELLQSREQDSRISMITARILDIGGFEFLEGMGTLHRAHRRSQVVTSEMLQADHQRQVQLTKALKLLKGLQTQMVVVQRLAWTPQKGQS
ncbi:hypothetical protein Tco_0863825 [Tanacetum coccineum]